MFNLLVLTSQISGFRNIIFTPFGRGYDRSEWKLVIYCAFVVRNRNCLLLYTASIQYCLPYIQNYAYQIYIFTVNN